MSRAAGLDPPEQDARTPIALVTGGSQGIGAALAAVLAAQDEVLVLVARSAEALEATARSIAARGGRVALTVPLDLAEPGSVAELQRRLSGAGLAVRDLVNNAGFGLAGEVADLPAAGQLGMVDLNCRALLELTLAFLPDIVARRGGILNVASVAGFSAGPGLAVYYATKAFVISLTRALAHELRHDGVRVSALCPGPTPTGFGVRAGFDHGRISRLVPQLSADAVARIGVRGWQARRPVVIPGIGNRVGVALMRLLPQAVVVPLIAKAQRRRRT